MTIPARPRPRGRPLVALVLLIGGWIGSRAVMLVNEEIGHPRARASRPVLAANAAPRPAVPAPVADTPSTPSAAAAVAAVAGPRIESARAPSMPIRSADVDGSGAGHPGTVPASPDLPGAVHSAPVRTASPPPRAPGPLSVPVVRSRGTMRWSGDGWLLLRGGSGAGLAAGAPAYGGSQAGAALRYRLGDGDRAASYLYARVAGAIALPGDRPEVALGIGLRPLPRFPVRLLAEARARAGGNAGGLRVRPALVAVSELPPARLPARFEGEFYGQAGYVAGRDATAFFDLQAVADRSLVRPAHDVDVRFGGGLWAGGQRGAARLDLGPRAAARLNLGGAAARVALDWRIRVAGNATPASGAALTFSTGF